jgi:transcriptional regulator with XRE-family HTH domain
MRLDEWLKQKRVRQEDFADMIGVRQSAISHLVRGKRNPSLELMLKIEAATKGKVRPNDWRAEPASTQRIAAE